MPGIQHGFHLMEGRDRKYAMETGKIFLDCSISLEVQEVPIHTLVSELLNFFCYFKSLKANELVRLKHVNIEYLARRMDIFRNFCRFV